MPETPTPSTDLNRAIRDAKKQAGEVSDAARDLYSQTVDSASQTAGSQTAVSSGRSVQLVAQRPHRDA